MSKHVLPAWQGYRTFFDRDVSNLDHKFFFSHLDKNNEHTNLHALKWVDCTTMQKEWSKFDSVVANLHWDIFEMSKKSFLHCRLPSAYSATELKMFHCGQVRKMLLTGLDLSILFGFLSRDKEDWGDIKRVTEVSSYHTGLLFVYIHHRGLDRITNRCLQSRTSRLTDLPILTSSWNLRLSPSLTIWTWTTKG
jgi:hypothetical protein